MAGGGGGKGWGEEYKGREEGRESARNFRESLLRLFCPPWESQECSWLGLWLFIYKAVWNPDLAWLLEAHGRYIIFIYKCVCVCVCVYIYMCVYKTVCLLYKKYVYVYFRLVHVHAGTDLVLIGEACSNFSPGSALPEFFSAAGQRILAPMEYLHAACCMLHAVCCTDHSPDTCLLLVLPLYTH